MASKQRLVSGSHSVLFETVAVIHSQIASSLAFFLILMFIEEARSYRTQLRNHNGAGREQPCSMLHYLPIPETLFNHACPFPINVLGCQQLRPLYRLL